ncbi:MAG: UBP-type zinc finger domain-containing protein [Coriobacteriia bacterium]
MKCSHYGQADPEIGGAADACEDCAKTGGTWVALRRCRVCGHVGCCDSSPNHHARAHWEATGHAIMQSAMPGQDWMWCYADDGYVGPDGELLEG